MRSARGVGLLGMAVAVAVAVDPVTIRRRSSRRSSSWFSHKEIGAALHLSENTVEGYVSDILIAHHLRDRTQLEIRAYDSGRVTPPETRDGTAHPPLG